MLSLSTYLPSKLFLVAAAAASAALAAASSESPRPSPPSPPPSIAAIFAELLAGEFANRFRVVVFGVIKSRTNVEAFGAHFPLVPSLELAVAERGSE